LKTNQLIGKIRSAAQLAAVLEVSAWPKPGNVHRTRDHSDARYEHFLVGSIVLGSSVGDAASKGLMAGKGRVSFSGIGIGKLVKKAVYNIAQAHNGGNTHLGVSLLFIPLAAAAGKTYTETNDMSLDILQSNVREVMQSTTARDAVSVYEAISLVSSPHELGKIEGIRSPDLLDKGAKRKILESEITLFNIMEDSSSYDSIAKELVSSMVISFNTGYRELLETFKGTGDINIATVHTFLRILSKIPDTFIARKIGLKKVKAVDQAVKLGMKETMWISKTAEQVLNQGGLTTQEGKTSLWEFDQKLQNLGKDYSPGTTADLTANSLMIGLLCGLKF